MRSRYVSGFSVHWGWLRAVGCGARIRQGCSEPWGTRSPSPALVHPFSSPLSLSLPSSAPSSLLHCFDCTSILSLPISSPVALPLSSFFSLNLSSSLFLCCFLPLFLSVRFSPHGYVIYNNFLSPLPSPPISHFPSVLLFHVTAFILQLLFMPLGRVCVGSRG